MLFTVWSEDPYRSTRDIDFLGWGENSFSRIETIIQELCSLQVEDDGLLFDANSITLTDIREEEDYSGIRVNLIARLGVAKANIQVDVGFGDIITPEAVEVECGTILDFPPPIIKAYPRETVVAEKLQAMVRLGMVNDRLKDFSDLYHMASHFDFDGRILCLAIKASFARRETDIPVATPVALTEKYYGSRDGEVRWKAFKKRVNVKSSISLADTCKLLYEFLMPPLMALADGKSFDQIWHPGSLWRSKDTTPQREEDQPI